MLSLLRILFFRRRPRPRSPVLVLRRAPPPSAPPSPVPPSAAAGKPAPAARVAGFALVPPAGGELGPAPLPGWIGDLADPRAQLAAVAAADYQRVPLLNRQEARLLPLLEACVRQWGDRRRVMARVALGEIIRPHPERGTQEERRRGYASINAKRVDFAIIDRWGLAVTVIEYQGSGHYHRDSFMRDAVKREALRKAGVPVVEIAQDQPQDEVRAVLRRILRPAANGPA